MRASGNLAELEGAAVCLDRRPDPDAHPVEQVVPDVDDLVVAARQEEDAP